MKLKTDMDISTKVVKYDGGDRKVTTYSIGDFGGNDITVKDNGSQLILSVHDGCSYEDGVPEMIIGFADMRAIRDLMTRLLDEDHCAGDKS